VVALKEAMSVAEAKADTECTEREKQDAGGGEVQQELRELGQKFGALEHDFKTQASELAKALQSAADAKVKPKRPFRKPGQPRR